MPPVNRKEAKLVKNRAKLVILNAKLVIIEGKLVKKQGKLVKQIENPFHIDGIGTNLQHFLQSHLRFKSGFVVNCDLINNTPFYKFL